ncbi:proline-rich protein 11-like isoform X2 [Littorina saxatilis]|uniref:Uncharacterized protein n=1 Tax=Littorina saxatilis TaxID=31220 RepID=A0AAN9AII2_9CAEN
MNPYSSDNALAAVSQAEASLARLSNMVDRMKHFGQRASAITGLNSMLVWCQAAISQAFGRMRQFVHGGLEYPTTLHKIQELESQLQQLLEEKEALSRSAAIHQTSVKQGEGLNCSKCQGRGIDNSQKESSSCQAPVQAPPPPPPPPPPPAPPPPPPPQVKVPLRIIRKSGTSQAKENKVKDSRPVITAEELLRVKLRPSRNTVPTSRGKNCSPKDEEASRENLKRMALRKTQSAVILRDVGNMIAIQAVDVARQKQVLKKTTLKRSPGGTPLLDRKRRRESGQGLTPMMNKALRLRFQAQSPCLSSESDGSPVSSPDNGSSFSSPSRMSPLVQHHTP